MVDYILQVDQDILLWIQMNIRREYLNPFVKFITHLGDTGIIWILISTFLTIKKTTRKTGILAWSSLATSFIIVNLFLKNIVARIRPYDYVNGLVSIIERQKDFSFPSGHASSSFAVAVILFLCFKNKFGNFALILAFLISLSRLYVGVHYPTDVIVGMLLGTISAVLVYQINKRMNALRKC